MDNTEERSMTGYHVVWEIDVEADSHQEAAAEAHRLVRKPDTTATVYDVIKDDEADFVRIDLTEATATPSPESHVEPFQARVQPWMMACFGAMISGDREERNHRFLEEALELVQSTGCTAQEAHQLVDYVYGRAVGEPHQEVGGVMVTLAALCLANDLDMHDAAETELVRIWTKVEQIRAKQAAKPKHSPLPGPSPQTTAVGSKSIIVCHIRTSAGARFSTHENEESLRVELIDYYNECLAEGDFELADDTELQEAQDAIEESEDVSWEEVLLP
jgi:hypothetical protein